MRKFLQIIGILSLLPMCTQCKTQEPPVAVMETWQMTYSDYRVLKYNTLDFAPKEYRDLTRAVTVTRTGDQLSIKGIFNEFPDISINGIIKEDSVYFEPTQLVERPDGKKLYVHSGFVNHGWPHSSASTSFRISFSPSASAGIIISDDGMEITYGPKLRYTTNNFWLSDDQKGNKVFYSKWNNGRVEGTGFPEAPNYIINTSFRKVSDNETMNVD